MQIRLTTFLAWCCASLLAATQIEADTANGDAVDASSFRCISGMTPVGDYFVDNLQRDLEATIAVASSKVGGVFPCGSVVQLVPTEVMVKREPGYNAVTRDSEFFELAVSAQDTQITTHGFVETVNRFSGNCFAWHTKARPESDLICGKDHGCDPISLTPAVIMAIQKTDPRCEPVELTQEEAAALQALLAATSSED